MDAGEFGAVPAVAAFDVVDPAFGSGAPLDHLAERTSVLELAAGGAGFGLTRDGDAADAEFVQLTLDAGFAVAAVGGDRAWCAAGAAGDPFDRGGELGCVGGVTDLDSVIEDDAVGVVEDLGLVTELDRLAEPALADRAGIGVVQADRFEAVLPTNPALISDRQHATFSGQSS